MKKTDMTAEHDVVNFSEEVTEAPAANHRSHSGTCVKAHGSTGLYHAVMLEVSSSEAPQSGKCSQKEEQRRKHSQRGRGERRIQIHRSTFKEHVFSRRSRSNKGTKANKENIDDLEKEEKNSKNEKSNAICRLKSNANSRRRRT